MEWWMGYTKNGLLEDKTNYEGKNRKTITKIKDEIFQTRFLKRYYRD